MGKAWNARTDIAEGMKFGRLTLLNIVFKGAGHNKRTYWKCKCECGKVIECQQRRLVVGDTRSCGCLRLEIIHSWKKPPIGLITSRMITMFKNSAKRRSIEFSVSQQELWDLWNKQEGKCAITGVPISLEGSPKSASIDRIDSHKDYTIDNIQWVHNVVNLMKRKMTLEELKEWCRLILNHK